MICLWWMGQGRFDGELMEHVRSHLEASFGAPVAPGRRAGWPAGAHDPARGQHASGRLLDWLAAQRPPEAERVLGVCVEDLFIPVLTFVFGEAMLDGPAAVVSTSRLADDSGGGERPGLLRSRLAKECAHELGHTFGLLHCPRRACVMARSAGVAEVDSKGSTFCRDCRLLLESSNQRGAAP